MKIELHDTITGKTKLIEFDDFPVFLKKGKIVNKLPRWVTALLPHEDMKYLDTNKGSKSAYKRIGDYVIIYDIKKG